MIRKFLTLILFCVSSLQANTLKNQAIIQLNQKVKVKEIFFEKNLQPVRCLSKRMNIWLYEADGELTENTIKSLRSVRGIKAAQLNHEVTERAIPNDTFFDQQWGMNNVGQGGGLVDADIDAPEAWDLVNRTTGADGREIVLAILDSGFDINHPDIDFYKNINEIPDNQIDDDNNGYTDDYSGYNAFDHNGTIYPSQHGTHVAGIAGARGNNNMGVCGVTWGMKIMPIICSSSDEANIIEAYGYVLENRARYNETGGQEGAFIVATNASWGIDQAQPEEFPLWSAIYDSLGAAGVLSCGATANASWNIDLVGDMPTACESPYLITVTNTTKTDEKNASAGYGMTTIDLGAPGTSIYSTLPNATYGTLSGTSMATPHVTGAIGLLYAAGEDSFYALADTNPAGAALLVKNSILNSVDPLAALQAITVSGGRLNLLDAVTALRANPAHNNNSVPQGVTLKLFPNPFNPNLNIRIGEENAKVRIFDIKGRLVKTFALGYRSQCLWDGRLENGKKAASGLYFIKAEVGGRQSVKKAVLLK